MSAGAQNRSRDLVEIRASALGRPAFLVVTLTVFVSCGATLFGLQAAHWVLVGTVALLFGLIGVGVAWAPSGVFCRPLLAVHTRRSELALTFDDGPNPTQTPAILDALEAHGHRATFFVIGRQAEQHPDLLAEIVRRGHSLANHSFSHGSFTNLSPPQRLAAELRRTGALLSEAGHPSRFFRAPVGLLSPRIARAAQLAELDLVGWTASARDGAPWRTAEQGVRRLLPHLRPGAILVLHDGARARGAPGIALPILRALFGELDARGLKSVTLEALLQC